MKKVFTFLLIIMAAFLLTGCGKKEEKKETKPKEEEKTDKVDLSKEEITIDDNDPIIKLFNSLSEYGVDLYKKGSYKEYEMVNNMYFISLKQLHEKYGYDISIYKGADGTVCDSDKSGIYFDINNTLNVDYKEDYPPVMPMLIGCSKDALPPENNNAQ